MTTLHDLKPTTKQTVNEITQRLGISMASNYDWCFSDSSDGPHLLNIWHDSMIEEDGDIYFIDDTADWADNNRKTATTVQLNRASAVTSLILTAYYKKQPVHVAILNGVRKQINNRETSEAHQRELDSMLWYPHHRGDDGRIRIIRGKPQSADFDPTTELHINDQFESNENLVPQKKIEQKGTTTFERDSEVIRLAKLRAEDGCCELCGEKGFKTANGGFYLEGHHVIPLNCGGPDDVRNVVAICADDHRRAHYSEDRHDIRDTMIWEILAKKYPNDELFFELLDKKSIDIKRTDSITRKLEDNKIES